MMHFKRLCRSSNKTISLYEYATVQYMNIDIQGLVVGNEPVYSIIKYFGGIM